MVLKHDYTALAEATGTFFAWQALSTTGENLGYVAGDTAALVNVDTDVETKIVIAQGTTADMDALASDRNAQDPIT